MRKKIVSIFLIICFSLFSATAQAQDEESTNIKADAAAAGSYHSTAISMVFWGVLLIAGIAVAAILIETSTSHSS